MPEPAEAAVTASANKIYYGWYIVGVCFITMSALGGIGYTFAVFFKPLIEQFHWSHTALSGVVSAGMVAGGLVTPLWGRWTDRAGGRIVVVTGAFFAGLSLLLRAKITTLWQLYLIATLGSVFFAGIDLIPLSTIISHWFRNKRGTAMGLMLIGGSIGGFIMPPLADYLIRRTGWRNSYAIFAGILWILIIPIAGLVLRRSPQEMGLLPDGEPEAKPSAVAEDDSKAGTKNKAKRFEVPEMNIHEALRTSAFWMIAIAFFLPMMSGIGLLTHLVMILTNAGVSSQTASACLGLIAALSIVGRIGFGFAADRFAVRKIYTTCYILEATGVGILLLTPLLGIKAFFAFILIYGLTGGGGLVLAPLIIGECFGLKNLGTIFGLLAISAVVGGAIGPLLVGYIFDTNGSYYPSFLIFVIGEATAAFAISRAKPAGVPYFILP